MLPTSALSLGQPSDFEPAYLGLHRTGELAERARRAVARLEAWRRYSKVPDYVEVNRAAVKEMHRQVGDFRSTRAASLDAGCSCATSSSRAAPRAARR